jgi:cholesterol oxidase
MRWPSRSAVRRREFLALGGAALAGAVLPGCAISVLPRTGLGRIAEAAYRDSLSRLVRRVARPDGSDALERGTGVLADSPDALRAIRDSRPGQPDVDVLIVGSGYGGAVCAARLAEQRRPGIRIALLERGREWPPGTFPDQLAEFNPFSRRTSWLGEQRSRNPLGLYGFHDRGDLEVVVGSGLGGGSLINCAVVLEAEETVFRQPAWPDALRDKRVLRSSYQRARRMLDARATPRDRFPPKLRLHLQVAEVLRARGEWDASAYPAELAITFDARTSQQGMRQHGCVQCGDCSTGCNLGAKNSLDMNYLPLAWVHGAELFTQVEVDRIEAGDGTHRVHYVHRPGAGHEEQRGWLTARVVILAAGTLGSTEILLRSRQQGGLALSDWLGRGFSANGNYLGLVDYQFAPSPVTTNTAGVGIAQGPPDVPVGTSIQGLIDFRRGDRPLSRRVVLEDLAHPSVHVSAVALLTLADLNHALTLLGCGHDAAAGEIRLEGDAVLVRWPDYGRQASRAEIVTLMREYASAHGGRFRPFSPVRNFTAHPLGGCRMGETVADGVVDDRGRVFDARRGAGDGAVHPGLYVIDGSTIPTALGNNPLLTITALAERAADLLIDDPAHAALFSPTEAAPAPEQLQRP